MSAFASLDRAPVSIELASGVLRDILDNSRPRVITAKIILDATSEMYDFTVEELCGRSRRRPLVTARQVGMYVCPPDDRPGYPAIAREYGGRDHTTVIHAVEKIGALMKERRQIYDQVTELIQTIRGTGTSLWSELGNTGRACGQAPPAVACAFLADRYFCGTLGTSAFLPTSVDRGEFSPIHSYWHPGDTSL